MTAINFSKALTGDTVSMVFYAKRLLAGGEVPFEKSHFIDAIQVRADAIYPDRLSPQSRFAKALTEDEVGRTLYAAVKRAPGSEVKPGSDTPEVEATRPMSEAETRLHVLATDHAKAHSMSYAAAYSYLYGHNDHRDLREQIRNEHLQRGLAAIHGGVSGTLSIAAAQRMEPAKDFTGTGYDRDIATKKSAESELERLARAYHAAHPEKSYESAFTKVLTAPENRALMKRAQNERIAALCCRLAV
jgi:hypothetical protein